MQPSTPAWLLTVTASRILIPTGTCVVLGAGTASFVIPEVLGVFTE